MVRIRLTALYAGLLIGSMVLLLGLSWLLLRGHLERTLPPVYAEDALSALLAQYALAVAGTALIAVAAGWVMAGRALRPMEEAIESQRRFVANASHELRSPLTVIRTETEVTLSDPGADVRDLREMGRVVLEATDRTEALLDGLLTLALSREPRRREEVVDLGLVAGRVARAVAPSASEEGVTFTVQVEPAAVRGDADLLERLVANLAENAVRHNHRGGFAELTVARRGDRAVVRIENGGPVIDPASVALLAEPFQRLDRCADAARGSGLGLSIVRSVAEAHGGELRLEARDEGGLAAEVQLPVIAG